MNSIANNRTSSFMQFHVYKSICNGNTGNSTSDNILVLPSKEPLTEG